MSRIVHSVEIRASKDRVWEIISDLDNETDYWYGTKEVKNISKEGDIVNREITQNFRNHTILQKAILHPKDSIDIQYLKGLTEGSKRLSIESMDPGLQRLTAYWNVRFAGIFWLLTPWLKGHVEKGTIDALARIKAAAEAPRIQKD